MRHSQHTDGEMQEALRASPMPRITLTGADERTDIAALAKLNAEIGLLYSASPEGRNRYPRYDWIYEASLELPHVALHVCGTPARLRLLNDDLPVAGFRRIQVNGSLMNSELEKLCALYPQHTVITQHQTYTAHLLTAKPRNHALLVDASGGRGLSPVFWGRPQTMKAVGYAGGLGPDNLAVELPKIGAIAGAAWWVDMESKLRVDDWFSLERAAEAVAIFEKWEAEQSQHEYHH